MKHRKKSREDESKMTRTEYTKELRKLQVELCRLQDWVKYKGLRIILVFEGRDGAGKGAPSRPSPNVSARASFAS